MRIWDNKHVQKWATPSFCHWLMSFLEPTLKDFPSPLEDGVWARDYWPTTQSELHLYSGRALAKRLCDIQKYSGQVKCLAGQRDIHIAAKMYVPLDSGRLTGMHEYKKNHVHRARAADRAWRKENTPSFLSIAAFFLSLFPSFLCSYASVLYKNCTCTLCKYICMDWPPCSWGGLEERNHWRGMAAERSLASESLYLLSPPDQQGIYTCTCTCMCMCHYTCMCH